jgi:hypothetical protein
MSTTDYHLIDKWRVEGQVKEVADVLEDALSLPRSWPSVYLLQGFSSPAALCPACGCSSPPANVPLPSSSFLWTA